MVSLLAQTVVPAPSGEAWPWVAFLSVIAVGALFIRYDTMRTQQINRCLDENKTLRQIADTRAANLEQEMREIRSERRR